MRSASRPSDEEIGRAWKIHSDADEIFHSRIQSFLFAQTFIVGAFAVMFAGLGANHPWGALMAAALAVLGLLLSVLLQRKLESIHEKIVYFKKQYVLYDPVFFDFMFMGRKAGPHDGAYEENRFENTFGRILPLLMNIFWLFALGIVIAFFFVDGGRGS
jgi:hypothetical protein